MDSAPPGVSGVNIDNCHNGSFVYSGSRDNSQSMASQGARPHPLSGQRCRGGADSCHAAWQCPGCHEAASHPSSRDCEARWELAVNLQTIFNRRRKYFLSNATPCPVTADHIIVTSNTGIGILFHDHRCSMQQASQQASIFIFTRFIYRNKLKADVHLLIVTSACATTGY